MEHPNLLKHNQVLRCLLGIPGRIVSLHGNDNITEFVMHDLCHASCLNLPKAAFFVDNPDFDCLKGVAGFDQKNCSPSTELIWQDPKVFSLFMETFPFNAQVRLIHQPSARKNKHKEEDIISGLSEKLQFDKPGFFLWDMKYANHGILLYETQGLDSLVQDYIADSASLLSLCPIH
jgi:hypothetical protein